MSGHPGFTRRHVVAATSLFAALRPLPAFAAEAIPAQPYFAGVNRALQSLADLGAPIAVAESQEMAALARRSDSAAVAAAEAILSRYTLADLSFASDGDVAVTLGGAPRTLVEQGWRVFLLKIINPTGRKDSITFTHGLSGLLSLSPGRMAFGGSLAQRAGLQDTVRPSAILQGMWLSVELFDSTPSRITGADIPSIRLSGIPVEYRIIQLFSRDAGKRRIDLSAYTFPPAGGFPSRSGHREFDFQSLPSRIIDLGVRDADGRACVAALTIKDGQGHIYPPQAMRIAPDMSFQQHVYRADGEAMRLPDGVYTVESWRGPEYLRGQQTVTVDGGHKRIDVRLRRWIDPAKWGWYSGDTHIHAAGCSHYSVPTEGVTPETMIRHVRGEGLSIGEVLTWAPGWYHQKQFFKGEADSPPASLEYPELQKANNASLQPHGTETDGESLLRYDVEVSGFPSSHAGHLVLLRLRDQDYPGAAVIEDWPSWNLPILQWAREQKALAGYAHCGMGMVVDSTNLPNYEIPPMDGIGTQEAIVDVTHGLVDFLAGCNTQPLAELNAWYHMLNCGFRMAFVGETDYPCVTGERPGVGRSYVRLPERPASDTGYEAWIDGLRQGRLYCGDGRSHILDFKVDGRRGGEDELDLRGPGTVAVEALVAARLEETPPPNLAAMKNPFLSGWHLEFARIGTSNEVPVELIVNGVAVARTTLVADGKPRTLRFDAEIVRSSWLALRILPSSHSHPVFVRANGKPLRASARSARWCKACVDKLWEVKSPFIRDSERAAAAAAFEHARQRYDAIARESDVE